MRSPLPGRVRPVVRETVLDNGLTVLVQEVHTAPLVSVWCWYRVGSRDEGPGLTGASHWVEHMNFRGTKNIPPDQMKGIVERFGGSWNGYTWVDQTTYLETASKDALDRMLFIEAERMDGCLYEAVACEAERSIIISELQGGENDPEQLLDVELTSTAFAVHPYGHPTIGWLADLQSMTRDDLYAHYRRHYVPSNATLVIVGDVDADDAVRRVVQHFGSIPSAERPVRPARVEPEQRAERRVILRRPSRTAYWRGSFHAPAARDPAFVPLLCADAVLTGASGLNIWSGSKVPTPQRSARLYRALVDGGLASSVTGALLPTEQPFLYYLTATVADGQTLASVEEAMFEGLDRVLREGVTDGELAKARAQLRARFVYDADSVTDIAHQLGYFQTIASWRFYHDLNDILDAVTLGEVNEALRRYIRTDNRTVGWFQPERDAAAQRAA